MSQNMFFSINVVLVLVMCGCTSGLYRYGEQKYYSSASALNAQRDDVANMIANIHPTNNPIGGRALIALPTQKLIEEKGIRITGFATREQIDFIVSGVEISVGSMAEALKRRKIFEEVSVSKSDHPETMTSSQHDAIIYWLLASPRQTQWFLKTPSNNKAVPIYMDQSLPLGAPRTLSWLDYIEKTAAAQLGR